MKIQKLLELIEPQVKNINMRNRKFDPKAAGGNVSAWALTDHERQQGYVGSGQYSSVKKDRDPHFVQKTSRDSDRAKEDGYWHFIKQVIDNKLWENPYFPRVYYFKKFHKGNSAHYRVKLETLVDMEELNRGELVAVVARMVGDDPEDMGIIQPYFKEGKVRDLIEKGKIRDLIETIFRRVWGGNPSKGMDSNLVSAMNLLKKMNENKNYYYDLHKGNIMFRRGPHGVHPVIVDPFSRPNH